MQTRQIIAVALLAFASIVNCQMLAFDADDECNEPSSTTAASHPNSSSAPVSVPVSQSSALSSFGDTFLTFSYMSSGPVASSSVALPSSSSEPTSTAQATHDAPPSSQPVIPSSSSASAPSATPSNTTPTGGSGSSGQGLSGACSPNGIFNCVGGTQYQQCANGKWAPLMPLAGTKCSEGQSMTLWREKVKMRQ